LIPGAWRGILNALRVVALDCRVAARTDLFTACALLSHQQTVAQDAFAKALFKCLRQATHRKPVFYQPGTVEMSFDEAWLIRAVMAAHHGDGDSVAFLIRSRVAPMHQRQVSFLVTGIAAQFAQT
jgi:hypothetical protein